MPYEYHGIILTFLLFFTSINSLTPSCLTTSLNNITFGYIHNLNFYLGQSQPANTSCSWLINNPEQITESYYVLSLRIIELETDPTLWSNELIFKTDDKQIILNDIDKRTFVIPSSSSLQIDFRTKSPRLQSTNLHIHRFLLEFTHINNPNYFRCLKSGLLIPKQWLCNCIYECSEDDHSDEDNCPLCTTIKSTNSLLCHANEIWCLPMISESLSNNNEDKLIQSNTKIDPKGVCIPREQNPKCSYSTDCETIISHYQDHGEISLDNIIHSNRQSLCFTIIAKEHHKIKFIINRYDFLDQYPDLELLIYDGSEQEKQLLLHSDWLSIKQIVQTRLNHIATIIIRKRLIQNENSVISSQHNHNNILLNITWLTSVCPDNQMLCGGHFETKCYSNIQRCDGIWDCLSGDDELGCVPASCPTTFSCNDPLRIPSDQPRCYIWSERCNGNAFCTDHTDERNCSKWWCNSNNGTFLCRNLNCIYETWVCDGANDCGDNSDERNCPYRIPRRIMTAAVMGATICCTLFIIALGCTCKLFHLRSAERRTSSRLLNPQQYIEQRRQHRISTTVDNPTDASSDTRRVAPPSYDQTMGLTDENEERQAVLAEHLRLAGLANFIPLSSVQSNSRHRRHRRHRRHHHRRTHSEGSRVALLEPNVVHPNTAISIPFANRLDRFRSQLRSLFTRNYSVNNNNSIQSNEFDIHPRHTPTPSIVLSTRSFIESRELPPPYTQDQLSSIRFESDIQPSTTTQPTTLLTRIRKRHIPLNTIRDYLEEQPSSPPPPVATIKDDEQASSDDDKLLMP